jgi:serine/threonine protein kinase
VGKERIDVVPSKFSAFPTRAVGIKPLPSQEIEDDKKRGEIEQKRNRIIQERMVERLKNEEHQKKKQEQERIDQENREKRVQEQRKLENQQRLVNEQARRDKIRKEDEEREVVRKRIMQEKVARYEAERLRSKKEHDQRMVAREQQEQAMEKTRQEKRNQEMLAKRQYEIEMDRLRIQEAQKKQRDKEQEERMLAEKRFIEKKLKVEVEAEALKKARQERDAQALKILQQKQQAEKTAQLKREAEAFKREKEEREIRQQKQKEVREAIIKAEKERMEIVKKKEQIYHMGQKEKELSSFFPRIDFYQFAIRNAHPDSANTFSSNFIIDPTDCKEKHDVRTDNADMEPGNVKLSASKCDYLTTLDATSSISAIVTNSKWHTSLKSVYKLCKQIPSKVQYNELNDLQKESLKNWILPENLPQLIKWIDQFREKRSKQIETWGKFAEVIDFTKTDKIILMGDLHGAIHTLLRNIIRFGAMGLLNLSTLKLEKDVKIIFIGDVLDRGIGQIPVLFFIFQLMELNKGQIFFNGGNHESKLFFQPEERSIYQNLTLQLEEMGFSGKSNQLEYDLTWLFRALSSAILLRIKELPTTKYIWIAHGMFEQNWLTKRFASEDAQATQTFLPIPILSDPPDTMWADFGFEKHEGRGVSFNKAQVLQFLNTNDISFMIRGHQDAYRNSYLCGNTYDDGTGPEDGFPMDSLKDVKIIGVQGMNLLNKNPKNPHVMASLWADKDLFLKTGMANVVTTEDAPLRAIDPEASTADKNSPMVVAPCLTLSSATDWEKPLTHDSFAVLHIQSINHPDQDESSPSLETNKNDMEQLFSCAQKQHFGYQPFKYISRGVYGQVFQACDTKNKCNYAIKVQTPHPQQRNVFLKHVESEFQLAKRSGNTVILDGTEMIAPKVYDQFTCTGKYLSGFMIMDLLQGPTLIDSYPYQQEDVFTALNIIKTLIEKLNIVHTDTHGNNFVFQRKPRGSLKIIDFGLVRPVKNKKEDALESMNRLWTSLCFAWSNQWEYMDDMEWHQFLRVFRETTNTCTKYLQDNYQVDGYVPREIHATLFYFVFHFPSVQRLFTANSDLSKWFHDFAFGNQVWNQVEKANTCVGSLTKCCIEFVNDCLAKEKIPRLTSPETIQIRERYVLLLEKIQEMGTSAFPRRGILFLKVKQIFKRFTDGGCF